MRKKHGKTSVIDNVLNYYAVSRGMTNKGFKEAPSHFTHPQRNVFLNTGSWAILYLPHSAIMNTNALSLRNQ
jgi:hypothetical protein